MAIAKTIAIIVAISTVALAGSRTRGQTQRRHHDEHEGGCEQNNTYMLTHSSPFCGEHDLKKAKQVEGMPEFD